MNICVLPPSSCSRQWVPLDPPRELSVSMLAGWLVQDHLTQGHLTWCPRLRNSWERECLVAGAWRVSRTLGGGEPCKRAWVGCWMCKAVQHVLCLCGVVCHRLPRTVARSCRAGLPKHSSCRPFVQPCCVGSFVSVVARGIPPATQGTGQHLLRGVLAVLGRQCSSGQSAQLLSCGAVCSRITQRT